MKIFTSHVIFEIASFYIQQIHIFESENLQNMYFIMLILNKSVLLLLQLSHWGASRSTPRRDFLTPRKAIVEWGQLSQDIVIGWDSLSRSRVKVVWWWCWGKWCFLEYVNELHICQMEVEKQCFEIFAQKISAKNMNNDLVFFRDEIEIFVHWISGSPRLALSLLDDSLHQAKWVLLARMRTVSPEVGWKWK